MVDFWAGGVVIFFMTKRALISVYDKNKITELAAGFQLRMPNAFFVPGGTEQMLLWVCRRVAHGNPLAGL
jgi:hypothetical protein